MDEYYIFVLKYEISQRTKMKQPFVKKIMTTDK